MNIVMVAENYLHDLETGLGFARSQREELERRGHDVTVITNHRPDVSHRDHKIVEVPSIALPGKRGGNISLPGLGHVDSILRGADIVQAYEPLMLGQWAAQRAAHYNLPSVYFHDPHQALTQSDVEMMNQYRAVLAPLPSDTSTLTTAGVTTPVYPVAYGFSPRQTDAIDPHVLHRQHGIGLDVPLLLYAGPLTTEANLPLLVDALLPIEHPLHFMIAAEGPARHSVEQHIFSRGAARSMHLLPAFKKHEQSSYRAASMALSAGGDSHPIWLIEAASQGVPVVAVRTPETEHAVRNRATGILTLPTKTALTRAVMQLLHRPALRHRYSLNAPKHAATFDMKRSIDQLLDVYALIRRLNHIEG